MKILGVDGLSPESLQRELELGAKLVQFEYCFSMILVTCKRSSEVHFIKSSDNRFLKALPYILVTAIFGWWGFPWGPIYTVGALFTNCTGGKDVTSLLLK